MRIFLIGSYVRVLAFFFSGGLFSLTSSIFLSVVGLSDEARSYSAELWFALEVNRDSAEELKSLALLGLINIGLDSLFSRSSKIPDLIFSPCWKT